MSKKYLEQHSSTGVSNKKVVSKFGMKIMSKLGWSDGDGLGKNKSGITECIQIRKREENLGLGASVNKNVNWSDMWWTKSYESVLNNVNIQKGSKSKEEEEVDSTTSDEEVQVTKNNKQTKQVKTKVNKKVESDSESESSSNSDEESFVSKKRKRTLKILKF